MGWDSVQMVSCPARHQGTVALDEQLTLLDAALQL